MIRLLLLLVFVWGLMPAQADDVIANKQVLLSDYSFLGDASILTDPKGTLSFESVRTQDFKPINGQLGSGFTSDTIWLKVGFNLPENIDMNQQWVLQLKNAFQDHVDIYVADGHGAFVHYVTGDHEAQDPRFISHRFPSFFVQVNSAQPLECYLRVQSRNAILLPLYLMTYKVWQEEEQRIQIWSGLFLGLAILLITVGLTSAFVFKQLTFIYYTLFILVIAFLRAVVFGWGNILLPLGWGDVLTTIAQGLMVLPLLYLTRSLLRIHQYFSNIFRLQLILAWFTFIWAIVCVFIGWQQWSTPLSQVVMMLLMISIALQSIKLIKVEPLAKYYLLFFSYYIFVFFLRIGALQGWWALNRFTDNAVSIGMLIQVLFIFIGMTYLSGKAREERIVSELLAQKAKEEVEKRQMFMNLLSHELMTPLAIIDISVRNLQDDVALAATGAQQRLTKIKTTTQNMKRLVNVCLAKEQVSEQTSFNRDCFDLKTLFEMIRQESIAKEKSAYLVMPDHIPAMTCRGRAQLLSMAISMLIDNAFKYSPAQAVVRLEVVSDEHSVSISVCDHGIGFDPSLLVPTPFVRGNNVQQRTGLGLGLSLVKQIIEWHHGVLRIQSLPNQGSQVSIRLPKIDA